MRTRRSSGRRLGGSLLRQGRWISQPIGRQLSLETLEDRQLLATITVTSLSDNLFPGGGVTLREAVQAANTDASVDGSVAGNGADTILFDAALSGETITLGGLELEITEALTIDATALAENVTIDGDQLSRIFNMTATAGDFMLAGLTLTGGRTTGDNVNSSDTTFSGGAVRSTGLVRLSGSTVSGNSTAGNNAHGGGISSGALVLTGSTVSGNSTEGSFAAGGGIRTFGALVITNSTVSGNSTAGSNATGGGTRSGGYLRLTNSTVSGNSTTGYLARGGGIHSSGALILTGSTVSGNSTEGSFAAGGGILSGFGPVTLTSSTVSGNSTAGNNAHGGGIRSFGAVTLTSSTVTDNHANHATSTGGGILNDNDTITLTHSIVAGNTAGGGSPDIDPGSGIFAVDFSLLGTAVTPDGSDNGNKFNDSPLLGPLAPNGGPTETHALLAGSPAIDAGSPGFDVVAIPNDQRGAPFGRGAGFRVDIGAYEQQTLDGLNLTVDTNVDENDADYSAGDLSLREAIGLANGSVGANTILFDTALSGQTITLGGSELEINEAVTIDATALAQNVTVDADQQSRIFEITAATGDFALAGLTLTGGQTLASDESGGAICSITNGNLTLDHSTVSGNSTAGFAAYGGGIYSQGAVTLTDSTVSGNSTAETFARGGGIYSQGAVTLTDSTVSGNSTAGWGADGGGISSQGALTLTSSTVSGNFTTADSADGGGIFSLLGAVTLTHSTVSGNSTAGNSADGGGIYSKGAVTLAHSTITDNHANHANAFGGGIWNDNDSVVITNSIVAGNTAGGGFDDIRPGTGTFFASHNLFGSVVLPIGGGGNVFTDNPLLGPLTINGGTTRTHAPLVGSLAINSGDPSFTGPPAFDQRGAPFLRVVGGRIDMGAVEVSAAVPGDFNGDGGVTATDIDLLCAEVQAGSGNLAFDLNGDNVLDHDDVVFLVETILGTQFGDANLDGAVTASGDGGLLLANLGAGGGHGWADGDFTCDGLVTASGDGALLLAGLAGDTAAPALVPTLHHQAADQLAETLAEALPADDHSDGRLTPRIARLSRSAAGVHHRKSPTHVESPTTERPAELSNPWQDFRRHRRRLVHENVTDTLFAATEEALEQSWRHIPFDSR